MKNKCAEANVWLPCCDVGVAIISQTVCRYGVNRRCSEAALVFKNLIEFSIVEKPFVPLRAGCFIRFPTMDFDNEDDNDDEYDDE